MYKLYNTQKDFTTGFKKFLLVFTAMTKDK